MTSISSLDYQTFAHLHDHWIDYPSHPLVPDIPQEEYELRIARARALMVQHDLDALVVTSSAIGHWFTSFSAPHEWHDRCPARSAWYILTQDGDYLYMTPTTAGEHTNTTRRSTWVTHIRAIVERIHPNEQPRHELWGLWQMPIIFAELGLTGARLAFELGDCMTLGLAVNDFLRLRELLPHAQLVDGSPIYRRLMSVHTPLEVERVRTALAAANWVYDQVPKLLRPGLTERAFMERLAEAFATHYDPDYTFDPVAAWDIRNPETGDSSFYHAVATDRIFRVGDTVSRGYSGVSYRCYGGDIDRVWHIGPAPERVRRSYRINWECVRAMEDLVRPGVRCSEVYAACAAVERHYGLPERQVGRIGHGLRNSGGLSIHPDCHTVLEPGMIISCEPMHAEPWGWFDLEDQYLVTETGHERLNRPAPEEIPVIEG
jgi:Xaa-Pro dipeptidase